MTVSLVTYIMDEYKGKWATKNFSCFAVCCQQKVKHVLEDIQFYINS